MVSKCHSKLQNKNELETIMTNGKGRRKIAFLKSTYKTDKITVITDNTESIARKTAVPLIKSFLVLGFKLILPFFKKFNYGIR